jgi:hypothetical protein
MKYTSISITIKNAKLLAMPLVERLTFTGNIGESVKSAQSFQVGEIVESALHESIALGIGLCYNK